MTSVIRGTTAFANHKGVKIWYEYVAANANNKPARGTILFIMGISTDALAWQNVFLDYFRADGYNVIRMDNRDVGMSDWLDYTKNPYNLSDMADDAIAVLDHLNIAKAHICGISMGGMIAQIVALQHPERVTSLIPIMSSAWVLAPLGLYWRSGHTLFRMFWHIAATRRKASPENLLLLQYKMMEILMGTRCKDTMSHATIKANFECNYYERKKYNPRAFLHQFKAIWTSGSRVSVLNQIKMPTLIIHGTIDPLIPMSHSKKLAKLIPHAKTAWIDGMGHAISPAYLAVVAKEMCAFLKSTKPTK
jgi:pimeloyl-ACP methyl ester carboxylesterase